MKEVFEAFVGCFNLAAWLIGALVLVVLTVYAAYELGKIMLEELREYLRQNERFIRWLDDQIEKEHAKKIQKKSKKFSKKY